MAKMRARGPERDRMVTGYKNAPGRGESHGQDAGTTRAIIRGMRAVTLLLVCALAAAAQPSPPSFRLPAGVQPVRYDLDLTIVPDRATFDGKVAIDIELEREQQVIWLNAKDLTIRAATMDRRPVRVITAREEFLGLIPEGPARARSARIEVAFTAKLSEKENRGAYRGRSGADWYVFTTFTPIEARRAFPCFDEPRFKTPWKLTLHVRREHTALANTRAVAEIAEAGGMKKVEFAPTLALPSELVAFAVGPFDAADGGTAGSKKIPLRVIVPRGRAADAAAAVAATPAILEQIESYTGIPYPWDKLDHIALTRSSFGAVENPGLISYRQQALLADPRRDTLERRRAMRSIMAHEIAHQWFGNLVTQAAWEDVWLSEGIATWLAGKISDAELPPFERGIDAGVTRDRMLAADALPAARVVRKPMNSREDMKDIYGPAVYGKAASVLAMIAHWLGDAALQRALRRYLRDHAFGVASIDDFAAALAAESGQDVAPVLRSFLDRAGVPLLDATIECRRIRIAPSAWTMPVCLHWDGGGRACSLVRAGQTEIAFNAGEACPAWVWTNDAGAGYYRSRLPAAALDAVIEHGYREMNGPERLSFASDLVAHAASGQTAASDAMRVLSKMARDPEPQVALAAVRLALSLSTVVPADSREQYASWLRQTFGIAAPPASQGFSIEQFFKR
jgi:alanyl aminopeptidase